jgi:regulator of chromosome condensation (RCC1) repeat-containing protein
MGRRLRRAAGVAALLAAGGPGCGDGASAPVASGVPLGGVAGISAGGTVACWGANGSGQLGDGSTVDQALPVVVTLAPEP